MSIGLRVEGAGMSVDGHLTLPAGGQWVPNDGHYRVWSARREVFDDVAPGPGDMTNPSKICASCETGGVCSGRGEVVDWVVVVVESNGRSHDALAVAGDSIQT
jgi:hypothetical protein